MRTMLLPIPGSSFLTSFLVMVHPFGPTLIPTAARHESVVSPSCWLCPARALHRGAARAYTRNLRLAAIGRNGNMQWEEDASGGSRCLCLENHQGGRLSSSPARLSCLRGYSRYLTPAYKPLNRIPDAKSTTM